MSIISLALSTQLVCTAVSFSFIFYVHRTFPMHLQVLCLLSLEPCLFLSLILTL